MRRHNFSPSLDFRIILRHWPPKTLVVASFFRFLEVMGFSWKFFYIPKAKCYIWLVASQTIDQTLFNCTFCSSSTNASKKSFYSQMFFDFDLTNLGFLTQENISQIYRSFGDGCIHHAGEFEKKRKQSSSLFYFSLFFSIISSFLSFSIPVLSLYTKHDNPAILLLCQKKRSYSTWLQTIVSYRLTWIWLIKILYKEITNISKIGVLKPVLSFK